MCLPAAPLALAAAALTAVGQGVSTIASVNEQKYKGKVAEMNVRMENASARDALDRGKVDLQRYYGQASQEQGAQRAALAANGIDINFGSAAAVRADTARAIDEDASTLRENTMRETRGFEIRAANFGAEAKGYRRAATAAGIEGAFKVGSTLLGGAQQYGKIKAGRA